MRCDIYIYIYVVRCQRVKYMKSVVCTVIYSHLVRICFTHQKFSKVFVSKMEFGKRKISRLVQIQSPDLPAVYSTLASIMSLQIKYKKKILQSRKCKLRDNISLMS